MEQDDISLTIEELAERTETSVRTIRYYIAEKMLPSPGSRGKGTVYTEEHLLRLRLIRRLVERREPLAKIRAMMANITDDEVRTLLAEEDERTQTLRLAEQAISPKAYIATLLDQARASRAPTPQAPAPPPVTRQAASQFSGPIRQSGTGGQASAWRRIELAPGVELHIQAEAEKRQQRLIARLLQVSDEEAHQQ